MSNDRFGAGKGGYAGSFDDERFASDNDRQVGIVAKLLYIYLKLCHVCLFSWREGITFCLLH